MRRRTAIVSSLIAVTALLSACADDDTAEPTVTTGTSADSPERLTVAAAFFPIETVVDAVGADTVDIVTLVPPGEAAHEYEPTAEQVTALEDADVVFYLGGNFQPGVEDALASLPSDVRTVDLLEGLTLLPITDPLAGVEGDVEGEALEDGSDPHVWLDPTNMAAMGETVATVLAELSGDGAATFGANAAAFRADMESLDSGIAGRLTDCESRVVVTAHRAFQYLTERYGLVQLPIAGISPSEEPSAKTLEAVAEAAEANGVTTIFFEENLPDDLARTVADEIGAEVGVLDPLESLSRDQLEAGETYRSVMLANADALAAGLRCS
jgi:zinc transport system substrate-binding protein